MQKFSGNGGQSELKLPGRSEFFFYVTLITHTLQSVPHVFIQV